MHIDPKKLAEAIGHLAEKLQIQSEPGKVLFGLECLLSFVLLIAIGIFALHDVIMAWAFRHFGDQAMEAFKWSLAVFVASMFFVLLREYFVSRKDK